MQQKITDKKAAEIEKTISVKEHARERYDFNSTTLL